MKEKYFILYDLNMSKEEDKEEGELKTSEEDKSPLFPSTKKIIHLLIGKGNEDSHVEPRILPIHISVHPAHIDWFDINADNITASALHLVSENVKDILDFYFQSITVKKQGMYVYIVCIYVCAYIYIYI